MTTHHHPTTLWEELKEAILTVGLYTSMNLEGNIFLPSSFPAAVIWFSTLLPSNAVQREQLRLR